jgi:hypothetical protein
MIGRKTEMKSTFEEKVWEILDRIGAILYPNDTAAYRDDQVLTALARLIIFEMSTVSCPHCREKIADDLKRNIPAMLNEANQVADAHEMRKHVRH